MDLMGIRRMLMTMGEIATMIGQFSKYEQKKVVFTNADNSIALLSFDVSFQPKLVFFSGGSDTNGYIKKGFLLFNYDTTNNLWGLINGKYTNGNTVSTEVTPTISESVPTAGNGKLVYYDGKIYVSRLSALMYWSNSDTYTFEIYG